MFSRLLLEPPMTDAESSRWTTAEERAVAAAFASERRRSEYLTWRAVVRRELGAVAIGYDAVGAPVVPGSEVHIGVSHCPGRIAVCISDRPCAVDVESETRDFSRAASRYLAPGERALAGDALIPAVVWCAKETLYKLYRRTELDLLRDIRITGVDFAAGTVDGCVLGEPSVRLSLLRRDGFVVVYRL